MLQQTDSPLFRLGFPRARLRWVALSLAGGLLLTGLSHALAQFQEDWDDPASTDCWSYFGTPPAGQGPVDTYPLVWSANGHGGGGGFVACELDRLTA